MDRYMIVKFDGKNVDDYISYLNMADLNGKPIPPPMRFMKNWWFTEILTNESERASQAWHDYIERWEIHNETKKVG